MFFLVGFTVVAGQFFGASSRHSFAVTSPGQYQDSLCGQEGSVGLLCLGKIHFTSQLHSIVFTTIVLYIAGLYF